MSDDVTRYARMSRLNSWEVYRVRTKTSIYTVGLHEHEGRKFAVMRGESKNLGGKIDVRDSDPRIDGRSLFSLPPSMWIGKSLEIGTIATSRIVEVSEEQDKDIITSVTRVTAIAPASEHEPEKSKKPAPESEYKEPPYPENYVREAQIAAYLLRKAYNERRLIEDLERDPEQLERFKVALADVALMLRALGGKMG
ncbi:hypothetical protein [Archangium primigenium]|uniref:hypothetical protein n=1 Tax=[Archangium] primigenium TaxID=2792470 RepID=UPI001955F80D|nr:hypothetical protein [Archangium primigenium]MBM7115487.1 hypothetical protein [Archangium primigenium]